MPGSVFFFFFFFSEIIIREYPGLHEKVVYGCNIT